MTGLRAGDTSLFSGRVRCSRGLRARWALLALLPLLGLASRARADDGLDTESRVKVNAVKARVQEWCRARQDLKIECPTCHGSGAVPTRGVLRPCSVCSGVGKAISKSRFAQIYYEMYSPATRSVPGAKDRATAKFVDARKDIKNIKNLGSYRVDAVRLLDDKHAAVQVYEERDTVSIETRWVFAQEPSSRKTDWFLWAEEGDGPWPGAVATPAVGAAPVPGSVTPAAPGSTALTGTALDDKRRPAIVSALAGAKLLHTVSKLLDDGGLLVIGLSRNRPLTSGQWRAAVETDVIAATKAVFGASDVWRGVRVVILVPMKDAFGAVEDRPAVAFSILRETFDRIQFDNLTQAEVIRLFEISPQSPQGCTAVEAEPVPETLTPGQDDAVREALKNGRLAHEIRKLGRVGDLLVLELALPSARSVDASDAAAPPAASRVAREVFGNIPVWNWIQVKFVLPYRDSFGKVEDKVHLVAALSRERFEKLNLETLEPGEILSHFEVSRPDLTGWTPWFKD